MFNSYQDRKVVIGALLLVLVFMIISLVEPDVDKESAQENKIEVISLESVKEPIEEVIIQEEVEESDYPKFTYSKDWGSEDSYLLAKIAMAEAEGESTKGKVLVILTVLNRVWDDQFPDTIEEVIFEEHGGVYQFSSVIPDGRWYTTEPNEECWKAVGIAQRAIYDYSNGALYFESCKQSSNWHSKNLEFLFQEGKHKFYK